MLKKFTKAFGEFVNESAGSEIRGLPLAEFMPLFSELVMMCPNLTEFVYPSDIHGHAGHVITLSRDGQFDERWMFTKETGLKEMEEDLLKIEKFYREDKNGKDSPTFYVWAVYTKGLKYNELENRLKAVGGMPSYQDFELSKLVDLLKTDEVLRDAVTRINSSLDSSAKRGFGDAMSRGDFGPLD